MAEKLTQEEFDARIAAAREEGKAEAKQEIEARAAKVGTPETVDARAAEIAGASKIEAFEAAPNPKHRIGLMARALAVCDNDTKRAAAWADRRGDKIAARALSTLVFEDGAAVIPENLSDDVLPALRAGSVVRASGAVEYAVRNNLTLPRVQTGSSFGWVGETKKFSKTQPAMQAAVLRPKKLGGIVPESKELMEDTSGRADQIITEDILGGMNEAEDAAFLEGLGTAYTPRGIYNMGGAETAITGSTAAAVLSDLQGCVDRFRTKKLPLRRPGWLLHPAVVGFLRTLENTGGFYPFAQGIENGTILGIPFKWSPQISVTASKSKIALVEFSSIAIGDQTMLEVAKSDQASYDDGTGNQISAFENDLVLFRARRRTDIVARRNGVEIEVLKDVTWGHS